MIPATTSSTSDGATGIPGVEAREARVREKTRGSRERFDRSQGYLAGGVSSGLRRAARPWPLFFDRGHGAAVVDVDGNTYTDYTLAWGPLMLGHRPAAVVNAVERCLRRGFTFGAQHELEITVAKKLTELIPCADRVCFANSGTEIVQLALRLARAATGRRKHLKFEGHYHGWGDSVLQSYHPSVEEMARFQDQPVPVGLGQQLSGEVLVAEWNNRQSVERALARAGGDLAAILCEPILCNSGCIFPESGFLEYLREVTAERGALLIFDEVITGFRVHLSGAQGLFGVVPDLATYAKAVGAGLPLSVLAGRAQYMELIAAGKVVHAGTLNGNPLSLAAADAALDFLSANGGSAFQELDLLSEHLRQGMEGLLRRHGYPVVVAGSGAVFHVSFMSEPARNYRETLKANQALYSDFALALLDEGILVLPDGRWYVSTAHTEIDVRNTLAAIERILA